MAIYHPLQKELLPLLTGSTLNFASGAKLTDLFG